jgi:hypothetical protein
VVTINLADIRALVVRAHPADAHVSCADCCDAARTRRDLAEIVPGLVDEVAARDRALDACAERIAGLLAEDTIWRREWLAMRSRMWKAETETDGLRAELRTVRRHLATSEQFPETYHGLTEVHFASLERLGRALDIEIDGRSAALEDVAAMIEDRDAWQRAAERMRPVYDAAGEAWDADATREGRAMCKLYQAVLDARRQALSEAVAKGGV